MAQRKSQDQPIPVRSFSQPDEQQDFDNGELSLIEMEGQQIGRVRLQQGWRHPDHHDDDTTPHIGYITRGAIRMKDTTGTEYVAGPDDVITLHQGVEAWCEEDTEMLDFSNPRTFAGIG